ncbi:MAG TPA: hypothetical protein VMR70_08585 [Flavisolibacter sp.]|nr:hypothetical protein [Flavisolibacter sp.]
MDVLKYKVIKSRKQYDDYCRALDGLLEVEESTKEQEQEIELLTVLIEKWDADHSSFRGLDPIQLLHSLMKEHGLGATDLTKVLDISKSYLSEVLHYKKGLSKEVIRKLAAHFKMAQEAFNRPYALSVTTYPVVRQAAKKVRKKVHAKGSQGQVVVKAAGKKRLQTA